MKRRIKNSQTMTNIKSITEEGIIELKTGEVASMLEVKAIDLSLTSKQEKQTFFSCLKSLYQIKDLNLKCYKLDEMINLNANKVNLDKKIEKLSNGEAKKKLLEESNKIPTSAAARIKRKLVKSIEKNY